MSDHISVEQLSALIDGDLSLTAREAVIGHLRTCPTCAATHERLVEVVAVMTAVPGERWSPEMTRTILHGLEAARLPPPHHTTGGRDWSLPIAIGLAVGGALALLVLTPFLFATTLDSLRLNILAALAAGAGLPVTGFLVTLLLLPALGLFAVPLIRHR